MTKKQRSILFLLSLILFIIISVTVVFYSQGFRFDFENKKITQTGAFYFKISPGNTQAYLNDKLTKKSDFLFNYIFINNLVPKKYKVKIQKDGYFPWEKSLEIKTTEVTEAKNIVLFKQSYNFTVLLEKTNDFFFIQDKIITLENKENMWELKLYNPKTNTKSHLIQSLDLIKLNNSIKKGVAFVDLISIPNSEYIIIQTKENDTLFYFLIKNLENTPLNIIPLAFLNNANARLINPQKLLFSQENALFEADIENNKVLPTPIKDIIAWNLLNSHIYYLSSNGSLIKSNLTYNTKETLNKTAFMIQEDTHYEILVFGDFIFIKENEDFFLLNAQTSNFEKFTDKNKGFKISPDFQKLLYFSNNEVTVLFLEEQKSQPKKTQGEKMFLARFSEEINNAFWLNPHYIIFSTGNKIKISEIDERDRINIIDIAEFPAPEEKNIKLYFNQIDKKLYILNNGNLSSSEPLF